MFSLLLLLLWALWGFAAVNSQTPYPITGVKVADPTKGIPLRKNINDLQRAGGAQWDLYIRSLSAMYKENPNNQLSYFQIAGIHGQPYIEWNGAGRGVSDGWQGYCPHGENLFLTWHRPYILLFEQRLVAHATRLAKLYPPSVRARYVKAAQALRSPYWDWAETPAVPPATVPKKIKVNIPDGNKLRLVEVDNPLAVYKFPQSALDGKFGPFDQGLKRKQIQRCLSPQKYPDTANRDLADLSLRQWTYDTMTIPRTFREFGSTSGGGMSLESIHNDIHSWATCGYQFTDARLSAFDPLFMLHHTNVDRLWAYWQFMRPSESLFKGSYNGDSRFSTRQGAVITRRSPLKPFFSVPPKFHTSQSVKTIRDFGYTYEGLEYWRKTKKQLQADSKAFINRKYGPPQLKVAAQAVQDGGEEETRYFTKVQVGVEELERPCSLNFYVNSTRVGRLSVLQQPQTGIFHGKFALDDVVEPDESSDGGKNSTVDALLAGIKVEIIKSGGISVPVSSVPSLKMEIQTVDVIPPEVITELPEYKEFDKTPAPRRQEGNPDSS